ncbi:hypothetical protein [Streptomyces sp. SPB4]|uniref:hypothetical protein n=1 Tax=Streptomyces sp. SPB4 TaxID=2940553 RepID=UPI002476A0EC|nr:hypothetical protein [Streptomyces sp. SPB4]MDH6542947.1 putative membrane protein YgcG [Streptomyces sp. SPB4]
MGGFVALVIAALALGPDTVTEVKEKRVPGPTVTVPGPTLTVTASPTLPPPGIPQLTGGTWKDAQARTVRLEARSAYGDVSLPADYSAWKVCGQDGTPADGAPASVVLHLAESACPAKIGDLLHSAPSPTPTPPPPPAPAPAPAPERNVDSGSGGSSNSGGGAASSGGSSSGDGGTTGGGSDAGSSRVVHAGSFCAPAGATGVTSAGTPMVCGPGSDGRNRWHKG